MSTIGNILWFLFGGLIGGLAWVLAGCLWCITIIGIPVGLQCFKFASLAFFPFGKEVVYGGGGFSFLVNLIWIIFFGLEMAIGYCILGCLWCITILGIPIGKQCFKMAKLSLMPFGASVVYLPSHSGTNSRYRRWTRQKSLGRSWCRSRSCTPRCHRSSHSSA